MTEPSLRSRRPHPPAIAAWLLAATPALAITVVAPPLEPGEATVTQIPDEEAAVMVPSASVEELIETARAQAYRFDSRGAEETLKQATQQAPDCAECWSNLAAVQLTLDKLGAADKSIERALAADELYAMAHYMRGRLNDARGRYDAAVAAYTRAINLDPNLADLRYNPGVLYNPHRLAVLLQRYRRVAAALELPLDDADSRATREADLNPMDAIVSSSGR